MDQHFNQLLTPNTYPDATLQNLPSFIKSGIGYYIDHVGNDLIKEKKRKLDEVDNDDTEETAKHSKSVVSEVQMNKLMEQAETVTLLDFNSLKQLLVSFQRKIKQNQVMRMKHEGQPEKFMDSEVELHKEISELYAISASPELYHVFVSDGGFASVLGMITHENTDISLAAIGLLQELTDPDSFQEDDDDEDEDATTSSSKDSTKSPQVLIDALLAGQGLELIVQNLSRLNESADEDAEGVHNSMNILENMLEIRQSDGSVSVAICEKTHILKYLLNRLNTKVFDANKLYCSEILSILLQSSTVNQRRISNLQGIDGLDALLQLVFQYRKTDPSSPEEQECVQNLFLCLSSLLSIRENQIKFLNNEGFELMIRCMKERKYGSSCAAKVIKYAISNNRENCEKLVEVGGLKYIFPLLMGHSLWKTNNAIDKKTAQGDVQTNEEISISIIGELCMQLSTSSNTDFPTRLLAKFLDNEKEKLDRCAELFGKYKKQLLATEGQLQSLHWTLLQGDEIDELEAVEDDDYMYIKRLEGGLYSLQQLSVILLFVCVHDSTDSQAYMKAVRAKLASCDVATEGSGAPVTLEHDVLVLVREWLVHLKAEAEDVDSQEDGVDGRERINLVKTQRRLLLSWCNALTSKLTPAIIKDQK